MVLLFIIKENKIAYVRKHRKLDKIKAYEIVKNVTEFYNETISEN
jgi:hypothetical protein